MQESEEATSHVRTIDWEEQAGALSALQDDVEDTEPDWEEIPTSSSSFVAATKVEQEIQPFHLENPKPV